jgi:hypothetical protein
MVTMLTWILSLFTGGLFSSISSTITAITGEISNAQIAQINATSDVEKAQYAAKVSQLQAQRDVLISNSQTGIGWIDEAIRLALAIPLVCFFGKVIFWDKVYASWPSYSTEPLSAIDTNVLYAILGYLFLYSAMKIFK